MIPRIVLSLVVALICLPSYGEIFKWVDENGKVHYGDSLPANAKQEAIKADINSFEKQTYEFTPAPKAALPQAKVIMYATSWCGYCRKARAYFNSQGIAFTEYDIEKNADAKRRYDALGGNGVPLILVGGEKMAGFSQDRFDSLYRR